MTAWDKLSAIEQHPQKVGGVWVFRDTRVPVAALFENLRDGASIAQFLEWFPGITLARLYPFEQRDEAR
jgi:uncharacterized protein (DUF433 family)